MSTDVKDLVKRLRDDLMSIGGPSYMQMMRQRHEAASALQAQAEEIKRLVKERDGRNADAVRRAGEKAVAIVRAESAERERDALKAEVERLKGERQEPANVGDTYQIEYDGFEGEVPVYLTRDGKDGVVLQQIGTQVVHVYGCNWLKK